MSEIRDNRRRFLLKAVVAATALPLLGRMSPVQAAPLRKLPLTNPQAKALSYVEDVTKTKHAALKPGSKCANCQFFTAATGACTLFAGYKVAPKGWCSAWAKKAA